MYQAVNNIQNSRVMFIVFVVYLMMLSVAQIA